MVRMEADNMEAVVMFQITSINKSQTMLWVSHSINYSFLSDFLHFPFPGGGYGNKSSGPNSWGSPGNGQPAYGSAEYWQQYQQYQQQYQQWQVFTDPYP